MKARPVGICWGGYLINGQTSRKKFKTGNLFLSIYVSETVRGKVFLKEKRPDL